MPLIIFPQLKDRKWLEQKYYSDGLSIERIAKLVGCSPHTARFRLLKAGIKIRSVSEGIRVKQNDYFILNESVLTGCLLGDGALDSYNRNSDNSFPRFTQKSKYIEHMQYLTTLFFEKDREKRIKPEIKKSTGKTYYVLRTLAKEELMSWFRKWYPPENKFVKLVPKDIQINETVLLHWFLDDGTCVYKIRPHGPPKSGITLYSQSFSKADQDFLCDLVNSKFSLQLYTAKCQDGTGYCIKLRQSSILDFLSIIGQPPVNTMSYKWKFY